MDAAEIQELLKTNPLTAPTGQEPRAWTPQEKAEFRRALEKVKEAERELNK